MGVQTLAQSRARGHHANIERLGKEVVTPKFFNRIEVVLALHQQTQVGLQNIAVGDAADTDRKFAVKGRINFQAFEVLPRQRQSGVGGEVVGQFFDTKVGHVSLTFRVKLICRLSC